MDAAKRRAEEARGQESKRLRGSPGPRLSRAPMKTRPSATKDETKLEARLRVRSGLDSPRPWGGLVVLDHSVGTGTFMSDGTARGTNAYVARAGISGHTTSSTSRV